MAKTLRIINLWLLFIVLLFVAKNVHSKDEDSRLKDISLNSDKNRLEIGVKGDFEINYGFLPGNPKSDLNDRYFIDLLGVRGAGLYCKNLQLIPNQKFLKKVRCGQNTLERVRVVLELNYPRKLKYTRKTGVKLSGVWVHLPKLPKAKKKPKRIAQKVAKEKDSSLPRGGSKLLSYSVVLDPGHGGKDPGAVSKKGHKEKNLALKLSKEVCVFITKIKGKKPFRCFLTRTKDVYMSLAKRVEKANQFNADLFISIHLNASPNPVHKGFEVYYLNLTDDRYAKKLASRENNYFEKPMDQVDFILADLSVKTYVQDSIRLANEISYNAKKSLRKNWPGFKNLGVKHALFYVLMGPQMPSVLVEAGFITNDVELKSFKSKYRRKILAKSIAQGIKMFFEKQESYASKEP